MDIFDKIKSLEFDATQFGFKWEYPSQIMDQINSECAEINEHLSDMNNQVDRSHLQEEIGDLLHAVFSLCIYCKFDPKITLQDAANKFERRLVAIKQLASEAGLESLNNYSFDDLMHIWKMAKQKVG